MKKLANWYIEIVWRNDQADDADVMAAESLAEFGKVDLWVETRATSTVLRGSFLRVLRWIAEQLAERPDVEPQKVRAIPFEESPVRDLDAFRNLLKDQAKTFLPG